MTDSCETRPPLTLNDFISEIGSLIENCITKRTICSREPYTYEISHSPTNVFAHFKFTPKFLEYVQTAHVVTVPKGKNVESATSYFEQLNGFIPNVQVCEYYVFEHEQDSVIDYVLPSVIVKECVNMMIDDYIHIFSEESYTSSHNLFTRTLLFWDESPVVSVDTPNLHLYDQIVNTPKDCLFQKWYKIGAHQKEVPFMFFKTLYMKHEIDKKKPLSMFFDAKQISFLRTNIFRMSGNSPDPDPSNPIFVCWFMLRLHLQNLIMKEPGIIGEKPVSTPAEEIPEDEKFVIVPGGEIVIGEIVEAVPEITTGEELVVEKTVSQEEAVPEITTGEELVVEKTVSQEEAVPEITKGEELVEEKTVSQEEAIPEISTSEGELVEEVIQPVLWSLSGKISELLNFKKKKEKVKKKVQNIQIVEQKEEITENEMNQYDHALTFSNIVFDHFTSKPVDISTVIMVAYIHQEKFNIVDFNNDLTLITLLQKIKLPNKIIYIINFQNNIFDNLTIVNSVLQASKKKKLFDYIIFDSIYANSDEMSTILVADNNNISKYLTSPNSGIVNVMKYFFEPPQITDMLSQCLSDEGNIIFHSPLNQKSLTKTLHNTENMDKDLQDTVFLKNFSLHFFKWYFYAYSKFFQVKQHEFLFQDVPHIPSNVIPTYVLLNSTERLYNIEIDFESEHKKLICKELDRSNEFEHEQKTFYPLHVTDRSLGCQMLLHELNTNWDSLQKVAPTSVDPFQFQTVQQLSDSMFMSKHLPKGFVFFLALNEILLLKVDFENMINHEKLLEFRGQVSIHLDYKYWCERLVGKYVNVAVVVLDITTNATFCFGRRISKDKLFFLFLMDGLWYPLFPVFTLQEIDTETGKRKYPMYGTIEEQLDFLGNMNDIFKTVKYIEPTK